VHDLPFKKETSPCNLAKVLRKEYNEDMKKLLPVSVLIIILFSCGPVLREEFMKKAVIDINFPEVMGDPGPHKGRLYVLGGIIARTTATETGSRIEAMYVPVDSRGFLQGFGVSSVRFLAEFPGKFLDPLIYREGREITIGGEFVATRKGRIDEMEYEYPLFTIKELFLWHERKEYYREDPYPYQYYPYWWYGPGWRYHYYYY
jgi:outer membrane lipoprotein